MGTTTWSRRWIAPLALAVCLPSMTSNAAESVVSVSDREKAAEAYDQGTAAYLAKDYEDAAPGFERASR